MITQASSDFSIESEAIKNSPLGEELTMEQCALLRDVVTTCSLERDEFLLEEGHKDDSIHVVLDGTLGVVKPTGGGDWVTLHLLHKGDVAGELGFIDGVEHSASIRAVSKCQVFTLHRKDFEALIHKDPDLVYRVMCSIIRIVHTILRRMNMQHVEMNNYITHQHGRY